MFPGFEFVKGLCDLAPGKYRIDNQSLFSIDKARRILKYEPKYGWRNPNPK
jgi:hypothetical protein